MALILELHIHLHYSFGSSLKCSGGLYLGSTQVSMQWLDQSCDFVYLESQDPLILKLIQCYNLMQF